MANGGNNVSDDTSLAPNGRGTTSSVKNYQNGCTECSSQLHKSYLEGIAVRTVYGLVPLKFALHWPVFASYDELSSCANWMGGRIPTMEEARSIYSHADGLKLKEAEQHLGKTVPAVNGFVPHPAPYVHNLHNLAISCMTV
jgi:L-histidine Nalpha-methyltransferase / hercynylcysteine S-oxide synthase